MGGVPAGAGRRRRAVRPPGRYRATCTGRGSSAGPVVVELAVDPDVLRAPERYDGPVHELTPAFEFTVERLHFLVWANTYDARAGEPVWWHGRKAARRFAGDGRDRGRPGRSSHWPTAHRSSSTAARQTHRSSPRRSGWSTAGARRPASCDRPPIGRRTAELAPDQRAAVVHPAGPARVIAPAGSGKTRVLTERLRHLVGRPRASIPER